MVRRCRRFRSSSRTQKGTSMSKSARNKNARKNALTQREVPWGGIAFFTVIGVVAVVAIAYAFMQTRSSASAGSPSIAGLVQKDNLGQEHTSSAVQYDATPPMGGNHDPMWQNCDARVYDQTLRNENAVHSLEHGAVWITYQPGLDAAQLNRLKAKV